VYVKPAKKAHGEIPPGTADLFFDPHHARNAFLVRDLLSVYLVEMHRRDGAFPLHAAAPAGRLIPASIRVISFLRA
jgi:hypothetical protein